MKKLLVPVDFSDQAKYALDFATNMAKKINVLIDVIHVADLPVTADPMGVNLQAYFSADLITQLEENLTEKLREFTKSIPKKQQGTCELKWGNPFSGISGYLGENDVDMIIMGTKGTSGVRELFVGSNAEKVVRHVKCPVITLKNPIDITDIKRIVFGNDLSLQQDQLAGKIKYLQNIFDARLDIVRINTPSRFRIDREVYKELREFAEKYSFKNYSLNIFSDVNEEEGLVYFADQVDANMMALGTHGRKGLGHLISGSIAEDVVNHAKRPIWTYNTGK
ncbi:MAG: universal stress protein [Cyclobacteriaceae bacterium]|nr:universal stress protein [Cyclobacteriaceae bacterium]